VTVVIVIDGSKGEGGGQVLRTALSLSLVTGEPFTITSIRKGREKAGILRQHLTAIRAAATVGQAVTRGDALGSTELVFHPGAPRAGTFTFSVGSAGSATLVCQTVLPALLVAGQRSVATFEGGTHNPSAPPFEALADAFVPLCVRMGARLRASIETRGFYPAGGGRFSLEVEPSSLGRLELVERGALVRRSVRALVSRVPESVAARELDTLLGALGWRDGVDAAASEAPSSPGPGNALVVTLEHAHVTEVFTAFGERGKRAEAVARELAAEVKAYLAVDAPVGPHLADQLVVPMLIGQGGRFRTSEPTGHLRTQIETIDHFAPGHVELERIGSVYEVCVKGLGRG
jgi:RNA 3'-terminal phosphate cyclase (ATP)